MVLQLFTPMYDHNASCLQYFRATKCDITRSYLSYFISFGNLKQTRRRQCLSRTDTMKLMQHRPPGQFCHICYLQVFKVVHHKRGGFLCILAVVVTYFGIILYIHVHVFKFASITDKQWKQTIWRGYDQYTLIN